MREIFLAIGYMVMIACSVFAIAVAGIFWKAYVLHDIWLMLVIPMFPKLTLLETQAVILCLIFSFLTYKNGNVKHNDKPQSEYERLISHMIEVMLAPAMFWVLAWLVSKIIY